MHAIRRNVDLTVLAHNNGICGLIKGQASPTSGLGKEAVMVVQREDVVSQPLSPLALAASTGFVARGFSGNKPHLSRLMQAAMRYRGFSLIDILQPCVSFNHINTCKWYKQRAYEINEQTHDRQDLRKALDLALEWGDKIPIGILYQTDKKAFTDQLKALIDTTLVKAPYARNKLESLLEGAE